MSDIGGHSYSHAIEAAGAEPHDHDDAPALVDSWAHLLIAFARLRIAILHKAQSHVQSTKGP
jgi:hypothetical protein